MSAPAAKPPARPPVNEPAAPLPQARALPAPQRPVVAEIAPPARPSTEAFGVDLNSFARYTPPAAPSASPLLAPVPKGSSAPLVVAVVGGCLILIICITGVTLWSLRGSWGGGSQVAATDDPAANGGIYTPPDTYDTSPSQGVPTTPASLPPAGAAGFTRPGDERSLRYRWRPGETYAYNYDCTLTANGQRSGTSGMVSYELGGGGSRQAPSETTESTSTGFVVDARGFLLTCAHCVEGATRITVHLNGHKYPGKVAALDSAHDLAVVQINASGLPVVPLGVQRPAELAQDVRAAGYPLSDVLGSSLKITQGSIAGFVEVDGNRLYQVDASINSGNSGGPVFDESGAALGVASAKLVGTDVTNVGFAVPIDFALPLLQYAGASYLAASGTAELKGAELARQIAPAVAFLEVSHSTSRGAVFDLQVAVSNSESFDLYPLVMDETGQPLSCDSPEQLPVFLGPVWSLAIETLPVGNEQQWATTEQTALTLTVPSQQSYDPYERFGRVDGYDDYYAPPFSRRGRLRERLLPQVETLEIPALRTVSYRIEQQTAQEVRIRKTVELQSTAGQEAGLAIGIEGSGVLRFDPQAGAPTALEFGGQITIQMNAEQMQIQYTYGYERFANAGPSRPAEQVASLPAPAAPSVPALPPPPAPVVPSTPPAAQPAPPPAQPAAPARPRGRSPQEESVLEHLAGVQQFLVSKKDANSAGIACWGLENDAKAGRIGRDPQDRTLPAPELQDEVRAALREFVEWLLQVDDPRQQGIAYKAIDALGLWGIPEDGELIDRCLDRWEGTEQRSMIESSLRALGNFPTRERAERVAAYLGESDLRHACEQSLKQFGSVAEPAVLPFLSDRNSDLRTQAAEILGEIGTRESIKALQDRWTEEENSSVRSRIEYALRKIRERI